jgi:hypothetical protein
MLVAGGAAISMLDNDGATARELALCANDPELAGYFESKLTNSSYFLRMLALTKLKFRKCN